MARTNKYASVNFNHIYDKNLGNNNTSTSSSSSNNNNNPTKRQSSSSSASSFYSTIASSNNLYKNHLPSARTHGRMLVLTRPTPKPITTVTTPPLSPSPSNPKPQLRIPDQARSEPEPDQISLRPLGPSGAGSSVSSPVIGQERPKEVGTVVWSPKPNKFVPPHLRPGFVGKEETPGPEVFRTKEAGQRQQQQQQGYFGSPGRYGVDGRPKSGGHEGIRIGGESDLNLTNRHRSSGNRPSSSGWHE